MDEEPEADVNTFWDLPEGTRITFIDTNPARGPSLIAHYLRAVERFRRQDVRSSDPEVEQVARELAGAALSEALNWADTIDQYLRKGPRDTKDTDRDPTWASKFSAEQRTLVAAFQYVRNRVHHQWWNAVAEQSYWASSCEQEKHWVWASLYWRGERWRRDPEGEGAYKTALCDRSLLVTLDELAAIFFEKRRWVIKREDIEQPGHEVLSPLKFDFE